jgi:sRNA-binding regulator protein Hfq
MKTVWVNPAFKDKVVVKPEEKKEEKPIVKEQPKPKPKKEKKENKEKAEAKPEKKVDNSPIQLTEPVVNKLKEKGINTEKLIDLLNKDFTKNALKEELKNRAFSNEDIIEVICCIKGRMSTPIPKSSRILGLEYKLFKYFKDNQIPIEARLINGATLTGKIKWFSEGLIALEVAGKPGTAVFHRFMIVSYTPIMENSLSETEIMQLPTDDVTGIEIKMMQQYRDNKTPLLFHMLGGIDIKGTLDWYEKLVCHIKSLDGKTDYTIHRGNMLYFEEVV